MRVLHQQSWPRGTFFLAFVAKKRIDQKTIKTCVESREVGGHNSNDMINKTNTNSLWFFKSTRLAFFYLQAFKVGFDL